MISIKNIFKLLFLSTLIFPSFNIASAAWSVPTASPPTFCNNSNQPGCEMPINVSVESQNKAGPLGISGTLVSFTSLFASSSAIGPGFLIKAGNPGSLMPVNPSAVLDVGGKISIRGGVPVQGAVLTSDATGLASWQNGLWNVVSGQPNDIENGNSGIVYFKNALAKRNSTVSATTQINLGGNSVTTGPGATVGGGDNNDINSISGYETIAGGQNNKIGNVNANDTNIASVIGGGYNNSITGAGGYNVIGGGQNNAIGGGASNGVILGGSSNAITSGATSAVIPGGESNSTQGDYSFAGGRNMKLGTNADGTFIWGNSASALPPYNIPDSFVVFPNSSPYKVVIGTTDSTGADVSINGSVKIFDTATSSDLDLYGQIRIRGGNPGANKVLTSDSTGLATWVDPTIIPPSSYGEGVMYLRQCCNNGSAGTCVGAQASYNCVSADDPAGCPSGWTAVGAVVNEYAGGSQLNRLRVCYLNTASTSQVMYLRVAAPSVPATCPTPGFPNNWTQADYREVYVGAQVNNVRTCYK